MAQCNLYLAYQLMATINAQLDFGV